MNNTIHKRLFIGVPMDEHCQQQINAAVLLLRDDKNIRWIAAHNRHLTLTFLGATRDADLLALQKSFAETYTTVIPFDFVLTQLTRFPDVRGHIFAAVNEVSPELLQLYQRTRSLLDRCHIPFEEREYRPHITLGRIRSQRQLHVHFDQRIAFTLHIDRVCLYESVATQDSREYQVLAQIPLAKNN